MNNMNQIAQARKRHQLSQTALAERVGCSRTYLWMLEHNTRKPGPRMARRIAQELGIEVHEVRDWAQEQQPELIK